MKNSEVKYTNLLEKLEEDLIFEIEGNGLLYERVMDTIYDEVEKYYTNKEREDKDFMEIYCKTIDEIKDTIGDYFNNLIIDDLLDNVTLLTLVEDIYEVTYKEFLEKKTA